MATIEHVEKVENWIPLRVVLVSCTNKEGLVSNVRKDGTMIEELPEEGICRVIAELNPDVIFLSTGGTFTALKEAGLNVMQISTYTGYPEMKTGLVKSLHPAIHAGILAHKQTASDDAFMKQQKLKYIDAIIVNFYALEKMREKEGVTFEVLRQAIDVGGPTMAHGARKAFISTALITDPKHYAALAQELKEHHGALSLATRLELAKAASTHITKYLLAVDTVIQQTTIEDLKACYTIQ
jgi:phosphoribosylaminoimidazolecarboxamide formyltransferase / IMP cyclohydrolase